MDQARQSRDRDSRVLFLTPTLHTIGGVESYYNALQLCDFDERVDFFFVTAGRPEHPIQLMRRLIRNYIRFRKKLKQNRYALIILNPSLNPNSFYRDAVFCWLALRWKKNVVVFFRGWSEPFESKILRVPLINWIFRQSYGKAGAYIVLGARFRDKLIKMGCSEGSRFWMETTVADTTFLPDFRIETRLVESASFHVLFLSRMVASKGARIAVQAFHAASAQLPSLRMELVMAGDGPELDELKTFVYNEQIRGVRFVGPVTGEKKKQVFFEADLFLLPTLAEGMPNVVLEAMLYGLPILSRDVGAIPDVVEQGTNGFLTDQTDPQVFADWIVALAMNTELRGRIAVANHEKAKQYYAADVVRARVLRIIEEAVGA